MQRKHKIFWTILYPLIPVFLFLKFGYRFQRAKNLPEQYIVLSNHNTDFDPLFVGASFPRQMYFVASEHISRWKHAFKFVDFIFAPIMRYKGTVAASTVMDILRKIRAGANVCIFAEGGRSWDGVTMPILPSTGKLVQKAGCALVTYKIEGGYFVSPNWSQGGTRRGHIRGRIVHVYSKEELAGMPVEEINRIIREDLYEDAYARQKALQKPYRGRKLAYRMENMLYLCPQCGAMETLRSHKDHVRCSACGLDFTYDAYGQLHGLPTKTVKELYRWLQEQSKAAARRGETYASPEASLYSVAKQQQTLLAKGPVSMDGQALRCGEVEIPLESITELSMHGRRALVFSANKTYYELIPGGEGNALKYLHLYEAFQSLQPAVSL